MTTTRGGNPMAPRFSRRYRSQMRTTSSQAWGWSCVPVSGRAGSSLASITSHWLTHNTAPVNPSVSAYTARSARPFDPGREAPIRVVVERPEPLVPVFEFLPLVQGVVRVRRVGMRLRAA